VIGTGVAGGHVPADDAVGLHGEPPLAGSTSSWSRSSSDRTVPGLNDECAAAALTSKPCTVGETIGPPAEKLYAVDPVGVDTITASGRVAHEAVPLDGDADRRHLSPGTRTSAMSLNEVTTEPSASVVCTAVRGSTVYSWLSMDDSASDRWPASTSARKPSRPTFTPSTGRLAAPHQPQRPQHRPVAAEADQQAGPLDQLGRRHRHGRAVDALDLLGQAEHGDAALLGPGEDGVDGRRAVAPGVEHHPDHVNHAHGLHPDTRAGPKPPITTNLSE
jgi:hypothetical protein